MNELLILEIQRELEKLKLPTPLAISKEIVDFSKGNKEVINLILKRISSNEPWEYIRGYTFFHKNKIFVNKDVLIPRVETEELVEKVVEKFRNHNQNFQIFDVGTGSGCIAIALSKVFKNTEVFAIEKDKKALKLAEKNIRLNKCKNIKLINADLLNFSFNTKKPTIIVSNLPYLSLKQVQNLDPSVKKHEPHSALVGGEKGHEIYKRLLKEISNKKIKTLYTIFEIDPNLSRYFQGEFLKDSYQKTRFLVIPPSRLK